MSILTHAEIQTAIKNGEIKIQGLKDGSIGTESIDLHLGSEIKMLTFNSTKKIYDEFEDYYLDIVDPKKPSKYIEIEWDDDDSILLLPNELYLGHTIEFVGSEFYHFSLHDKSSTARIGIGTHLNSGFGDCGFYGQITLEIEVSKPTLLYKGMAICQISFETMQGSRMLYSDRESSKYMNQTGATESKIQNNFIPEVTFESISKLAHQKGLHIDANKELWTNKPISYEIYERADQTLFTCKTLEEIKTYLEAL